MLEHLNIAIIGAGNMGEAIVSGLLQQHIVSPEHIFATDPRAERRQELEVRYQIVMSDNNLEAIRQSQVVIFAVKPQTIPDILPQLHEGWQDNDLCISIAAGIPMKTFSTLLHHAAIVRAMPNMPAQIGEGMTVWTATHHVNKTQRLWAQTIFSSFGQEIFVQDEHYLDMATAINGSGPAYIFLMLEAMIDAGVHLGFPRQIAEALVFQTMLGSVRYAMQSPLHLAQLRNSVTSPGGTTAAALNTLMRGGLPTILSDAIWSAYHRSCELRSRG